MSRIGDKNLDELINDYIMSDRSDLNVIYASSKKISAEYKSLVKKLGSSDKAKELVTRIISEIDVAEIMEDDSHEAVPDLQKLKQLWDG